MSDWLKLLPEILLSLTLGLVIAWDLAIPPRGRKSALCWTSLLGLVAAGILVWTVPGGAFGGAFIQDLLARFLKTLVLGSAALVLLSSWDFDQVWGRPLGEYLALLLSSTLGMLFIASGNELVLLYVGLELATFPLVLLTAYRPSDVKSAEGGLKYLIIAGLGSAIFLFGLSLVFATTGVTRISLLANAVATGFGPLLILGVLCMLAGIGFKLGLVPFHMWAPDTYEGAPTPVTAFLSVASKTAGFALALRVLASALPGVRAEWGMVLAVLSAASMFLGNLAAIPQTNLKRLMAYSSIAQAGYIVMGLVAFETIGLSSLLFYLAAYLFTNLAAFGVVIAIERSTGSTDLPAYMGLAQRSPRLALILMLALLSLAGIPPLAGFTAKFYLFAAVYGQGYVWLVFLGVINSAISLYYYLRVVRALYIAPPEAEAPSLKPLPGALTTVLTLTMVGILLLGVYPGPVVAVARAAVSAWF